MGRGLVLMVVGSSAGVALWMNDPGRVVSRLRRAWERLVQSKCEGCEQLVRTLNSTRRELELMQHNAAESEMLLRKLGDFEAESVLRGAELDSARRHVRRLEKDLASVKRQLDDAQRQCVVKTAEATSLRAQTMRLAVDCGKLQLRLRGITPATSAATSGASSPQLPGSPVAHRHFLTSSSNPGNRMVAQRLEIEQAMRTQLPQPTRIASPEAVLLPEQPTGPKPRTPRMSADRPVAVNGGEKSGVTASEAAALALRETNKSKFEKVKQQRNAYREQLNEAVIAMTRLRTELTELKRGVATGDSSSVSSGLA